MSASSGDPKSSGAHAPPKTQAIAGYYSTLCMGGSIQIAGTQSASGSSINWESLDVFNSFDNANRILSVKDWDQVPVSALVGLSSNSAKNSAEAHLNQSLNTSFFALYKLHKLRSFTIVYKDFQTSIERTTAGGIQFKDPFKLEFGWFPSGIYSISTPGLAVNSQIVPSQMINSTDEFRRTYAVEGGAWYDMATFLHYTDKINWRSVADLFASKGARPLYDLGTPLEKFAFRVRNIPLGMTNVQIDFKYTIEIEAHWDHYYFMPNNMPVYYGDSIIKAGSRSKRALEEDQMEAQVHGNTREFRAELTN